MLILAEEARKVGQLDEAIRLYKEYLKYKEDPYVYNNLAGIYIMKEDYQTAESLLIRALDLKYDELFEINLLITFWKVGNRSKVCKILREKQFSAENSDIIQYFIEECK